MGSIFHVPLARTSEDGLIAQAKRHGARLVGTHLTAAAIDYREADYRQPLILLMGNEQQGLTEKLAAACDALVRIPMRGKADSLNLAVSTGLMIYEALRRERLTAALGARISSLRMRSFMRWIWVCVARVSCSSAVSVPSCRSTIDVSTCMSSRRLATSVVSR